MRRWRNVTLTLAALVVLVPAVAFAQETTGTLAGTVLDPDQKPLAVASVEVAGPTGQRQVLTDDAGRFLLAFLVPGTYKVTITADGFASLTDDAVRIGLGQRTVRRYTLVPVMEQEIRVVGQREQVIDLSNVQTGSNISAEVAEAIPLGRNVSNVMFLAAGVKGGGGTGSQNPSVSGSSGFENQYVFDGVNVTNAGYGALGSYSIVHGSQGQGINFSFVKETQVITGGFMPEYGQATGGILNVITKSGTNEWEGSLFGYSIPQGLQSTFGTPDLATAPYGPVLSDTHLDYGFDLGGPLVKDHLFFWAGLNKVREERKRDAPAGFPLETVGPFTRETDTLNWAAKLTILPNPEHRIDVSAFGDPTETNFSYRTNASLRAPDMGQFSQIEYGYENWAIKYQGTVTPNFLIDATVANAHNSFEESFPAEYDKHRFSDLVNNQLGIDPFIPITGGIGFYEGKLESDNTQYNIKFTNLIKTHQLKYGIGIEQIDYNSSSNRTGPTYTTRNGAQTTTGASGQRRIDRGLDPATPGAETVIDPATGLPVVVVYRVTRTKLSDLSLSTTSDYKYAFIQDDWSITPNVHALFGFRWEEQSINGTDTKYTFPGEFSPRAGLTWDPTHDGRSKVYGSVARFYEKIPLDMAVRAFSTEVSLSRGEYYDAALTRPVTDPGATRYAILGAEATEIVPGTRNSYTDEILVGYERDLGKGWSIKGEYKHRQIGRALEDFADTPGSLIAFGEADFGHYIVGNVPPSGFTFPPGVSFPEVTRNYDSLMVEATKKYNDRWFLTTQYTLSKLHGNYEGLFRNDNGQSDPNLTSLYDFPDEGIFYYTFKNGALNTDRAHRLQAYGAYNWQNGWSIGSRVQVQTGTPKLALASHPVYENGGEISLVRRGQAGRTPTQTVVDLNFGKKWKLPTSFDSHVGIEVDIFNFFNQRVATGFDYDVDSGVELDVCDIDPMDPTCPDAAARYERFRQSIANGVPNDDYGKPTVYSRPREVRIGFKWTF